MMNAEILLEHLNQNFDWDEEITRVAKESLTLTQVWTHFMWPFWGHVRPYKTAINNF